jgi:hypothetical protein
MTASTSQLPEAETTASERRRGVLRRLRGFFLLEQRLAHVQRVGFSAGDPGWPEFVLARAALADAGQLADSLESEPAASLLYRSAVLLLAQALCAHPARPLSHENAPDGVPLLQRLLSELTGAQRPRVEWALDPSEGEARLARFSEADRRLAIDGLRAVARGLSRVLEAELAPVQRVLVARRRRITLAVALFSVASVWLGVKLLSRKNLALHKNVAVTSSCADLDVSPERLVDGNRSELGFHSEKEPDPSATIDLGRVRRLHSVQVYNRLDCCQARAVPLRLELSSDGVEYHGWRAGPKYSRCGRPR